MQTFLPYADFHRSAAALDTSRLGNQAYREGKTLLGGGWKNHPASRMWSGHRRALAEYVLACFDELTKRERHYPKHIQEVMALRDSLPNTGNPPWLGNEDFHASHRSNLLRKLPEWYGKFGWTEPNDLPYVWPKGD